MTKNNLINIINNINNESYSWDLYFIKHNKSKNKNSYEFTQYTFTNENGFQNKYISDVCQIIITKLNTDIDEVVPYTGNDAQQSCSQLSVTNPLIKEAFYKFTLGLDSAERSLTNNMDKYNAYLLHGINSEDNNKNLFFLKFSNPVLKLKNSSQIFFKYSKQSQLLDDFKESVCRLYYNVDCIIANNTLFTINQSFEKFFELDSTIQTVKKEALHKIIDEHLNAFDDSEMIRRSFQSYTNPKIFITLEQHRVNLLKDFEGRRHIAEVLDIEITDDKKLKMDKEKAIYLLKYFCYRILKDAESQLTVEVSSVTKRNINS